ncbi:L-asparaginase [Kosakonia pseudosacchari]|uniref:L-asparaginase n=1 Tax=Kosakonia pseudosacchari TaxID=1646340 RepID=A0ABX4IRA3_9ENTR|nr:L-asparaginase [Kosakonia sacchari]PDO87539.1 L-asparaginase [Kosakonia pseudosacchari]
MLLAILNLGSAHNPRVLRVRSGCCALSVFKLSSTITPTKPNS